MRQKFQEIMRLPGHQDAIWPTVSDIPTVLSWISIVGATQEVEPGRRYGALLEDRMGPFKLRADLDIEIQERVEGRSIRARGAGEDRQIRSRLSVDVTLVLSEEGDDTVVDVSGSYEVTGRPAALGAGSIRMKASTILAEFFGRAERALSRGAAT